MPSIEGNLSEDGIARVRIKVRQKKGNSHVTLPMAIGALDTCAELIHAQPGLLSGLGFQAAAGSTHVESTDLSGNVWTCAAEICILDDGSSDCWIPLRIVQMKIPVPNCHFLIGQVFLKTSRFLSDGPNSKFTLDW